MASILENGDRLFGEEISSRGNILTADDEESFLESTAELFRGEGFQVTTASDAFQAVEQLRERRYDVLVSDINMPGNPNLELVRELSLQKHAPPIILVTAYPSLETAIESVGLSIDAYLVKPVIFSDLLEKVEKSISRQKAIKAVKSTGNALENWMGDLSKIQQSIETKRGDSVLVGLEKFVELTVNNMGRCLTDLMNVSDVIGTEDVKTTACHLLNCPTLETLTAALLETVDVLEKTKHSFKSKDLGNLRKKLQVIVDGLPRNVSGTR